MGDFSGQKLIKTYRDMGLCISASWECRDCVLLPDIKYKWVDEVEDALK